MRSLILRNKVLLLPLGILFSCCLSALCARICLLQGVEFFLFMLFVLYLPGLAFNLIAKIKYENPINRIFSSFAIGYSFSIIVYLVCLILGYQLYVFVPTIIIIGISFYVIWYRRNEVAWSDVKKEDIYKILLFYFVMYGTCLLVYQGNTLSPHVNGVLNANQDYIFWLKNQAAVMTSYPVPDFNIYGQQLQYHFFPYLPLAIAHIITGIELFDLCFTFSYIIGVLLFICGTYLLASLFVSKAWLSYALFMIFFCTNVEWITYANFSVHIYYYMGFTEAVAISLTSFFFLCLANRNKENRNIVLSLSVVLLFVAFGLKAPVAGVSLIGLGVYCVISFIKGETRKTGFALGMSYLIAFGLSLLVVTSGHQLKMSKNNYNFDVTDTIFKSGWFHRVYNIVENFSNLPIIAYLASLTLYLLCSLFLFYTMMLIALHFGTRKINILKFCMISIVLGGISLSLCLHHYGFAQIWFYHAMVPYSILLPFSLFSNIDNAKNISTIKRYVISLSILGFLCFAYVHFYSALGGAYNIVYGVWHDNSKIQVLTFGSNISAGEMEGLCWIRENTPKDAVLLSNKVIAKSGDRSSILSAFTERQSFYENYHYADASKDSIIQQKLCLITQCFNGDEEAIKSIKARGVDYIVCFKQQPYEKLLLSNFMHKCIFVNTDMYVFKL